MLKHKLNGWNKSSIECYNKGCMCSICDIPKVMSTPCKMKEAVLELVKVFGKPEQKDEIYD